MTPSVPIRFLNMTEYRLKQLCGRLLQQRSPHTPPHTALRRCAQSAPALVLVLVQTAYAQSDPWTASANNLQTAFTGPIATALIAVAVVVTGMVFAFSEGQGKRQLAGLTFGGAMALGAMRFMSWLFT